MSHRIALLILVMLFLLAACNLGTTELTEVPTLTPIDAPSTVGNPVVSILSPQSGTEVVVDETVFVNASVTNALGITSVQLFANDRVAKVIPFEVGASVATRSILLDFIPQTEGDVTLRVVAYRGEDRSDPAEIQISVRSSQSGVIVTSPPSSNVPQIDPNDPTCRALINTGLNFRTGPSTDYDIITVLSTGSLLPIIGRVGDNSWWKLRDGFTEGWVSSQYTTEYGICTSVPVVAPPASPTPDEPTSAPLPTETPIPTATSEPTATTTPGIPDLVVTSIDGEQNAVIAVGESSVIETYSVTVTNTGNGSTGQFAAVLAMNGNTYDLGVVSNLGAGESISLSIDLTFDAGGSYTLNVTADIDNSVDELSEVNNYGILPINVTDFNES